MRADMGFPRSWRPRRGGRLAVGAALILLASLDAGCLELPSLPPRSDAAPADAPLGAGLAVIGVVADSADGRRWDPSAIPRRPRIGVLLSARLDDALPSGTDPGAVLLLTTAGGPRDLEELAADLEARPLRAATLARVLDAEVSAVGTRIDLVPAAPLDPGAVIVVCVGAWARSGRRTLGTPFLRALTVSTDPAAGARATDAWPPGGALEVGPEVPLLAVRFDGLLDVGAETLELREASGRSVPARVRSASCAEIGWSGPRCAALEPTAPLRAETRHTLRLGDALDATGAAVPAFEATFVTARAGEATPPTLGAISCALDEVAADVGCLFADDALVSVRVGAGEPLRLALDTDAGRVRTVLSRGEGSIGLSGLPAGSVFDAVLRATDTAGRTTALPLALETHPRLPAISIVEVRADPLGREPVQEYVELENRGAFAVDLAGLWLADAPDHAGDALPALLVPPGGRVLVVSDDFDPDAPEDARVPPGVPLARVEGSLGSGGLASYGEPLFLRDAEGRRLSAAPALPARPGVCIVRRSADPRTGAVEAFGYDPAGTCTPGTE